MSPSLDQLAEKHPIRTEYVKANGLTFEVDQCGEGEKFALLLHGFPEHSYSWRYQLPLLAELGYTAWAPNMRGYGKSSRPKGVRSYTIDHLWDDVSGLIDAKGASNTTLIAHDWGAIIAWTYAMAKLRPLERLVIMNVPHPAAGNKNVSWQQLKKSWYIFFFQIPRLPEWGLTRNDAQAVGEAFRGMAIDKTRFPDEVCDVYRRNILQPGAATAMVNYYRGLFRTRKMREMNGGNPPMIDIPTMMVWGEEDSALGKELTYGTDEFVRDLTIRYLPNVSHWVQQEAPEKVNLYLEDFLTGNPVRD